MKHWHKCARWQRRGIACPFEGLPQHGDIEDRSEPRRPIGPARLTEEQKPFVPTLPEMGVVKPKMPATVGLG